MSNLKHLNLASLKEAKKDSKTRIEIARTVSESIKIRMLNTHPDRLEELEKKHNYYTSIISGQSERIKWIEHYIKLKKE